MKRRYGVLPTMHCFQRYILYRRSSGKIGLGMKHSLKHKIGMSSVNSGMFHYYHSTWPVQNIPLYAMHCRKYFVYSLGLAYTHLICFHCYTHTHTHTPTHKYWFIYLKQYFPYIRVKYVCSTSKFHVMFIHIRVSSINLYK